MPTTRGFACLVVDTAVLERGLREAERASEHTVLGECPIVDEDLPLERGGRRLERDVEPDRLLRVGDEREINAVGGPARRVLRHAHGRDRQRTTLDRERARNAMCLPAAG